MFRRRLEIQIDDHLILLIFSLPCIVSKMRVCVIQKTDSK